MKVTRDTPEAPYNMSSLFYIELHELRKAKARAFISGDFDMYRDVLEEIYTSISFVMTKNEIKQFDKDFSEAGMFLINGSPFTKNRFRVIDRNLVKMMDDHKMIFPKIKVPSIDDLRKRFKLSQNDSDTPVNENQVIPGDKKTK